MLVRTDKIPDFLTSPYPYVDRPRSNGIYGVTEIMYCLRKSYLGRKVPAPTALSFEQRRLFARGHALETIFFGDAQNPIHFKGGNVGGRDFSKIEGHTDHSTVDQDGRPTVVEFKTTRHMWLSHPDGRKFFNKSQARKTLSKEEMKLVELHPMQSHLDQLMLYMMLNDAKRGVLIYHELSSDDNYVWEVEDTDISDEFKDKMKARLDELDRCFKNNVVPEKCPGYDFECRLCHMGKNGVCLLCDQKGFSVDEFVSDLDKKGDPNAFMEVVGSYYDRFGLDKSILMNDGR